MPVARADNGLSIAYQTKGTGTQNLVFLHAGGPTSTRRSRAEILPPCGRSPATCEATASPTISAGAEPEEQVPAWLKHESDNRRGANRPITECWVARAVAASRATD